MPTQQTTSPGQKPANPTERVPTLRGLSGDRLGSRTPNSPRNQRSDAHKLRKSGVGYEQYPRAQAEVLVDCVTYIVCSSVGLDVGGESIPYIAGWGEDGALDAIREYAATIDTIARRIEESLAPGRETSSANEALALPHHAA